MEITEQSFLEPGFEHILDQPNPEDDDCTKTDDSSSEPPQ